MKRLDPSISEYYSPLVVYSDDLNRIVEYIAEVSNSVELRTEEYAFESVRELCEHYEPGASLTDLSVKAISPSVALEFRHYQCSLYVGSSQPATAGLVWKIDSAMRPCRRWPRWIYSGFGQVAFTTLGSLLIVPAFIAHIGVGVATSALWLAGVLWLFSVPLFRHSLVVLQPRASSGLRGFTKRNRDQILLAVISGLLGLVIGVLGTLIVRWIVE